MATTKPRITISLTPDAYAVARRLSSVQGRPMATVLSEYYEQATPVLSRIADALELLNRQALQVQNEQAEALLSIATDIDAVQPALFDAISKVVSLASVGPGAAHNRTQPPGCNHGGQVSFYPSTRGVE